MGSSDRSYYILNNKEYLFANDNEWFIHVDGSKRFYNTNVEVNK